MISHATLAQPSNLRVSATGERSVRDVENLLRAELDDTRAALQGCEERLHLVTLAADVFTWELDPSNGRIGFSSNMPVVIGFVLPDDIGQIPSLLHPDDRSMVALAFRRALHSREGFCATFRVLHPQRGGVVWICAQGAVRMDGAFRGSLLGAAQNITERKEMQQALRRTEEFRAFFERTAAGAVQLSGITHRFTRVNRRFVEMTGYTAAELRKMTFADLAGLDDRAKRQELITALFSADGPERTSERRLRRRDGSELWVLITTSNVREADSSPSRTAAIVQDITDQKQAEEALRAREHELAAIFAQAAAGLCELTLSGTFVRANDELCRMLARSREELVGASAVELTHAEDREAMQQALVAVIAHGGSVGVDKRYTKPDGEFVWANSRLTRLDDSTGAARAILVVTIDLTERQQALEAVQASEAELRRAGEELERRVQDRTAELKVANHALRLEIGERERVEHGRQELLRQIVVAEEEERRRISRELHDELGQQIGALLLALKALEGRAALAGASAELRNAHGIAETVAREVHEMAVTLRPTALDDLGLGSALGNYVQEWSVRTGIAADHHITGFDEQRLPPYLEITVYRVVQEALTNVLKHAVATQVSIIVDRRAESVTTIIEDNGRGFDASAMPPNSGRLGLVGMKERAGLAGGELRIESSPGAGTTVFLILPLSPHTSQYDQA